jgi:hypothetical protein
VVEFIEGAAMAMAVATNPVVATVLRRSVVDER